MKQVIQDFKSGDLYVDDVPPPSLTKGMVLVENTFSLISAGTERSTSIELPLLHFAFVFCCC
ncbi:MAG: hypothetical protein EOO01_10850, partial [Chitinophagaceae bacterium]